jgi:hypothetical protein
MCVKYSGDLVKYSGDLVKYLKNLELLDKFRSHTCIHTYIHTHTSLLMKGMCVKYLKILNHVINEFRPMTFFHSSTCNNTKYVIWVYEYLCMYIYIYIYIPICSKRTYILRGRHVIQEFRPMLFFHSAICNKH